MSREHDGWIVSESGPPDADHAALLLPGALATAPFYDELLAEPKLGAASIRFVVTTLPGFGRTPPLDDLSMENLASRAGKLAADLGCDVVVGHSFGGNVAIEMVAAGEFSGPVVLLSPSYSRVDESKFLRVLDHMARLLGHLPYAAMLKLVGTAVKGNLASERRKELVAELKKNDPRFLRRQMRSYLEYLDRHGSLARRLCDSGVRAWVAFGEYDDIGLTADEHRVLEDCPHVTVVEIADAGHFTLNEKLGPVVELVLAAVETIAPGS